MWSSYPYAFSLPFPFPQYVGSFVALSQFLVASSLIVIHLLSRCHVSSWELRSIHIFKYCEKIKDDLVTVIEKQMHKALLIHLVGRQISLAS